MSNTYTAHRIFQSLPRKSFSINSRWSTKCNINKTKINENSLVWITWRRFYIIQSKKFMSSNSYTQPWTLPQPSTSLKGKQIHIYYLDMTQRTYEIRPDDKFWYQWSLILLTRTKKSTINKSNIKTENPKENNFKCNDWRKVTQRSNLWKEVLTFNHLTIIASEL